MAKPKKLPSFCYIRWDGDKGDEYLCATETIENIEHGTKVGIYKLQEIKTMRRVETLEESLTD